MNHRIRLLPLALLLASALASAGCAESGSGASADDANGGELADVPSPIGSDDAAADALDTWESPPDTQGSTPDSTPDDGGTSPVDVADTAGPGPAPAPERCRGELDEDGDSLVDCDDPDCQAWELCAPDGCSNGMDDDGDGLTDCSDPNCLQVAPCAIDSGVQYLFCLVEKGCSCEIGVDCPDVQPGWAQCQASCQNDLFCPGSCLDELSPPVLEKYYSYISCYQDHCADVITNEESNACFLEYCYELYQDYLFGGEQSCAGFQDCNALCGESASCGVYCYGSMSDTGGQDLTSYFECQLALCDTDLDGEADGQMCAAMAFWSCMEAGGACFATETLQSGETCAAVLDCITACQGQAPPTLGDCVFGCTSHLDQAHLADLSALMACLVDACGTGDQSLTLACLANEATASCAAQYAQCGADVVVAENCSNETDDDGDGAVDCSDPDCASSEACPAPAVLLAVWIADATEACPSEPQAATPGVDVDAVLFIDALGFAQPAAFATREGPELCAENPHSDPVAAQGPPDGSWISLNGGMLELLFATPTEAPFGDILVIAGGDADAELYVVSYGFTGAEGTPPTVLGTGSGTKTFPLSPP